MPYVQRNSKGEITGVYAVAQSGYAEEFLPDQNGEVVAFRAPLPDAPKPEPLTPAQEQMWKRVSVEYDALPSFAQHFNHAISNLELGLSTLLYAILNAKKSKLAYAIYYSPTSLEARCDLVENALIQIASENDALDSLIPSWALISERLRRIRNVRNAIAHGSPVTLNIRGKAYARWIPPAFDVIRIGRKIDRRQIPGLSLNDLKQGATKVHSLTECIDAVNRTVTGFHASEALQPKFRELEDRLTALRNQ